VVYINKNGVCIVVKIVECPRCNNKGLKIDINKGYKVVATGRPLKDFPSNIMCTVCKRIIKYDVVKED
jgi:hypothetical protein